MVMWMLLYLHLLATNYEVIIPLITPHLWPLLINYEIVITTAKRYIINGKTLP